jgi:hypothetical protein
MNTTRYIVVACWIVPERGIPEHSYWDHQSPGFLDPRTKRIPLAYVSRLWTATRQWIITIATFSLKYAMSPASIVWPRLSQNNNSPPPPPPPGWGHIVQGRIIRGTNKHMVKEIPTTKFRDSLIRDTLSARFTFRLHCKKRSSVFPSPAGMSPTRLSLAGKI